MGNRFLKPSGFKIRRLWIFAAIGIITLIFSNSLGTEQQNYAIEDNEEFEIAFIISDEVFTNSNSMTIEQIQKYLEEKNSPLADKELYQKYYLTYTHDMEIYDLVFPNGKLARESSPAEIIYFSVRIQPKKNLALNNINQKILLVFLQLREKNFFESSIIDQNYLDNILEYKSNEFTSQHINEQGFLNQILGFATQLMKDFRSIKYALERNKPKNNTNRKIYFSKNAATHSLIKNLKDLSEVSLLQNISKKMFNDFRVNSINTNMVYPIDNFPGYSSCPSDQEDPKRTEDPRSWYSLVYRGKYWPQSELRCEGSGSHPGVDIRVDLNTPVKAIYDGIISTIGPNNSRWGYYIIIKHENLLVSDHPFYSIYAHLNKNDYFKTGDEVEKGSTIGLSGNTDGDSKISTGAHLHFQIDRDTYEDGRSFTHPYWPFIQYFEDVPTRDAYNDEEDINPPVVEKFTYNPIRFIEEGTKCLLTTGEGTLGLEQLEFQLAFDKIGGKSVLGCPQDTVKTDGFYSYKSTKCDYQSFWNGVIEYHTNNDYQGKAFAVVNPLYEKWKEFGFNLETFWQNFLGYPIGNLSTEFLSSHKTPYKYQRFEGGRLVYNINSGKVFEIHSEIFNKWDDLGGASHELGIPTSDEREATISPKGTKGKVSNFEGGHIHWHETGDHAQQAFETHGAIDTEYANNYGSGSDLGFPISDEKDWNGKRRSNFEGGYIYWDPSTNQTHVVIYSDTSTTSSTTSSTSSTTTTIPTTSTTSISTSTSISSSTTSSSTTTSMHIQPSTTTISTSSSITSSIIIPPSSTTTSTISTTTSIPNSEIPSASSFQYPLLNYQVTSYNFGQFVSDSGYHTGQDCVGQGGTPVFAVANGKVSFSGPKGGYGSLIVIDHLLPDGNWYYSLYGHISGKRWKIDENKIVRKGQKIGYLADDEEDGSTNWGPHLHFAIRKDSKNDYPDSGDSRWMAGYTPSNPANFSWVNPTDFVSNHECKLLASNAAIRWHPDGTLIRASGQNEVYLIHNGKKKHVTNAEFLNKHYYGFYWNNIIEVSTQEINCFPNGKEIAHPPKLVRVTGSDSVYLIFNDTYKRHFASPVVFEGLGNNWGDIIEITASELNLYQNDPVCPELQAPYPPGSLIRSFTGNDVYVILNGKKRKISTAEVFNSLGYNWSCIVTESASVINNIDEIYPPIDYNKITQCNISYTTTTTSGFSSTTTSIIIPPSSSTTSSTVSSSSTSSSISTTSSTTTSVGPEGRDLVWIYKTPIPEAKSYAACAVVDGKIYIIGGSGGNTLSNYEYAPIQNTWTKKADLPNNRAVEGGAAALNSLIYVVGGNSDNKFMIYNPATNSWSMGPDIPTPRKGPSVISANGKIYAIGGSNPGLNITEEFNPATNTWTKKSDIPTGREFSAAAVIDNLIYIFGGKGGSEEELEIFNPITNSWTKKTFLFNYPTPRSIVTAIGINGRMYVIGGFNWNKALDNVETYYSSTNAWKAKNGLLTARYGAVAVVVNNKIYVIGGENSNGRLDSVEEGTFTGAKDQYSISGQVLLSSASEQMHIQDGLGGVEINGLPGNPHTDSSGYYSAGADFGWTGTAVPTKTGFTFSPTSHFYFYLESDQSNQDYAANSISSTTSIPSSSSTTSSSTSSSTTSSISTSSSTGSTSSSTTTTVKPVCPRLGDVNGDEAITPGDAQIAFEIYLQRITPDSCQLKTGDANCNGNITPGDAQMIFEHYLGKSELPESCIESAVTMESFAPIKKRQGQLRIGNAEIGSEGMIKIPIILNDAIGIKSFGLDIQYDPQSMDFIDVRRTALTKDFVAVDANVITKGIQTNQEPSAY